MSARNEIFVSKTAILKRRSGRISVIGSMKEMILVRISVGRACRVDGPGGSRLAVEEAIIFAVQSLRLLHHQETSTTFQDRRYCIPVNGE